MSLNLVDTMNSILQSGSKLSLSTEALAFLAATYVYDNESPEDQIITEYELRQQYGILAELTSQNDSSDQARGFENLINNLLVQNLMWRFQSDELDTPAQYRLTYLGKALADSIVQQENMSNETLIHLFGAVSGTLGRILDTLKRVEQGDDAETDEEVLHQLQEAVSSVVERLIRREYYFDKQHNEYKQKYRDMIVNSDEVGSLEVTKDLLTKLNSYMKEMDTAILQGAIESSEILTNIMTLSEVLNKSDLANKAYLLSVQVEKIRIWASGRQMDWNHFFDSICLFISKSISIGGHKEMARKLGGLLNNFHNMPVNFDLPSHKMERWCWDETVLIPKNDDLIDYSEGLIETQVVESEDVLKEIRDEATRWAKAKLSCDGSLSLEDALKHYIGSYSNTDLVTIIYTVMDVIAQDKGSMKVNPQEWIRVGDKKISNFLCVR